MKTYTHLVFDVDGTLINTAKIHFASLERALKNMWGEEAELPDLRFSFGIPGVTTMERLNFPDPEAAHLEWERTYIESSKEVGIELFEGMRDILERLVGTEASLGIITSKTREEYEEDFYKRGLGSYFSCAITASDTERGKPYADPMIEYMKRTGAKPQEVLYFGDSVYDMECARAAGVDHALVLWGSLMPEGIEATYRLKEPGEILSFVKDM